MTNNLFATLLSWLGLLVHLVVGFLVLRRLGSPRLLPLLNLMIAGAVLVYWIRQWYDYLFGGILWYATDQLMPLYALIVVVVASLSLAGRYQGTVFHWVVFGVDTTVFIVAVYLATFLRFNRLF